MVDDRVKGEVQDDAFAVVRDLVLDDRNVPGVSQIWAICDDSNAVPVNSVAGDIDTSGRFNRNTNIIPYYGIVRDHEPVPTRSADQNTDARSPRRVRDLVVGHLEVARLVDRDSDLSTPLNMVS